MDRRSPQQKKLDDRAFPVRVHVLVPERGFENLLLDMHRWLDTEVGRGNFAAHGAGTGSRAKTGPATVSPVSSVNSRCAASRRFSSFSTVPLATDQACVPLFAQNGPPG
jgi:hypothetical protein